MVKLLDFGLAKAFSAGETPSANPDNSPTLTMGGTNLGVILGTAAYMAPEQAKGKKVDKRADIWSWGVVLCELLTGERMFQGEDGAETLAAVIHKQPDLERVPAKVRRALAECLQKDPRSRLRDIGDAKRLLEQAPVTVSSGSRLRMVGTLAAALVIMCVALALIAWKHFQEEPLQVTKLSFPPPQKGSFPPALPTMAVSPDGRRVAFEAIVEGKRGLWVRDLNDSSPRMLAAIESNPELPFWAPDSRRLGFFDGSKLKRIDVTGGPAVTIADAGASAPGSGAWNQDDVILFGTLNTPLLSRVPAAGGTPAPVTELDKARNETGHWAPWFLPDGRHFLYFALASDPEKNGVYVGDLASKARKQVIGFGTRAIYVNPGYLLYLRDRTLMAQPFDTRKLKTTGEPFPIAEQVDLINAVQAGPLGHFSASQNGTLMYTTGGEGGNVQLTWFDRTGKKLDTAGAAGDLQQFSLSPDGTTIAFTRRDEQTGRYHIWTRDLVHSSESRLTFMGGNGFPVWSADGRHIFFSSNRDGPYKLYRKAANNTGSEEIVEAAFRLPMDASRDGRYLFTTTPNAKTGNDIWVLPLFGERKPFAYVATEFQEGQPRLSPDGHWLAYQSNDSKRNEIYMVSFPLLGGKWQISSNGGSDPVWSRDGRELYYYSPDNKIMAVEIKPGVEFQFGVPKALFGVLIALNNISFEVSKDGRFLLPVRVEQEAPAPMTVVLNWPELLKKRY